MCVLLSIYEMGLKLSSLILQYFGQYRQAGNGLDLAETGALIRSKIFPAILVFRIPVLILTPHEFRCE